LDLYDGVVGGVLHVSKGGLHWGWHWHWERSYLGWVWCDGVWVLREEWGMGCWVVRKGIIVYAGSSGV